MNNIIYLDYHSTTPCDPRVVEAMLPFFGDIYGNPFNHYHVAGRKANNCMEEARENVAELINANGGDVYFTSGATESNNLVILGIARGHRGNRRKIVTTPIEHKSVLKACDYLEECGFAITYLPIDHTGTVVLEATSDIIDENTLLVSVQTANNEIGTIQPIKKIAEVAHLRGALVHCDAAQSVGKIAADVKALGIDFLSMSAHKMYGPKGVGALYIRRNRKHLLEPLYWGGEQEKGIRPGTSNVPGIVGFGKACTICQREMNAEADRISGLRDLLENNLKKYIPDIMINGFLAKRLPGNSSITFPGVEGDVLLLNLPQLALSIGSACNTGAIEPSYILTSIGLSRELASSTVRFGLGRFSTKEDILEAGSLIKQTYSRLIE